MSLFGFLFGKGPHSNLDIRPECIWLNRAAKKRGVQRDLARLSQGDAVAILVIAHFQEAFSQVEQLVADYAGPTPAMAVIASDLSSEVSKHLSLNENSRIELLIVQRHPLKDVDDRVLEEFAESLPCRVGVSRHSALDEPLMKLFAGESVMKMLEQLGMNEDEPIVSKMVARRIDQAQRKITQNVTSNRGATSIQEWFELNGIAIPEE